MSIANPTTYAEWYWANQVDANKTYADDTEKSLIAYIQPLLTEVTALPGFPAPIAAMFAALGTPGHFGLAGIAETSLGHMGNSSLLSGLTPMLRALGYASNERFLGKRIDPDTAAVLLQRSLITDDLFKTRLQGEGFDEYEQEMYYRSRLPYPDINGMLQWARYTSDDRETFTKLQKKLDIPDEDFQIWEFLNQMRLTTADVQSLFVRGYMGEQDARTELRRDGWRENDAAAILDLAYVVPNPMIQLQAGLFGGENNETIKDRLTMSGVHPDYLDDFIQANLAKPNPQDIIRWMLRRDPNLSNLGQDLRRIGVHPEYIDVFRELAYPVPPMADIITMAVREAFTPSIAQRFGQYDDYPTDLTRFAAMNGISDEWAKRYWAAHWSLPSPSQGYEMMHRGIITQDELSLLMRALDIMPFWRDKLMQMSFKPLTRVDVRRMYQLGVLAESEVNKSYRDLGYDTENAKRLTDFTVKQTLSAQTGFTTTDVVSAYKNSYVNRQEAFNMLGDLGIKADTISRILDAAEHQRDWAILNERIRAIGNEYKQGLYDKESAERLLGNLRLPKDKIEALMGQWYKESTARASELWTKAEVMQFLVRGIIDNTRAVKELKMLGYDAEHINAIVTSAKYKKN